MDSVFLVKSINLTSDGLLCKPFPTWLKSRWLPQGSAVTRYPDMSDKKEERPGRGSIWQWAGKLNFCNKGKIFSTWPADMGWLVYEVWAKNISKPCSIHPGPWQWRHHYLVNSIISDVKNHSSLEMPRLLLEASLWLYWFDFVWMSGLLSLLKWDWVPWLKDKEEEKEWGRGSQRKEESKRPRSIIQPSIHPSILH